MSILQASSGSELTPLVKPPITREQLRRYADASGDYNPIHLDEEAAQRVGLDGVIAHGMLSMAFLGQFVQQQINDTSGAYISELKVRFVDMVRVGDALTCHGVVMGHKMHEDGSTLVAIECWEHNQQGEKVTIGEAVVAVPSTDS